MNGSVDKKTTKQVRIGAGWHRILTSIAKSEGKTLIGLLDEIFSDYLYRRRVRLGIKNESD